MDCGVQTGREKVLLYSPKHVMTMSMEMASRNKHLGGKSRKMGSEELKYVLYRTKSHKKSFRD